MIVLEFFTVGIPGPAFLLCAVKGGGFMPISPFDKGREGRGDERSIIKNSRHFSCDRVTTKSFNFIHAVKSRQMSAISFIS